MELKHMVDAGMTPIDAQATAANTSPDSRTHERGYRSATTPPTRVKTTSAPSLSRVRPSVAHGAVVESRVPPKLAG